MATLDLTADQATMLSEVLDSYLGDLRMEIAGTDSMDYRNRLKEREDFIKQLLADLRHD